MSDEKVILIFMAIFIAITLLGGILIVLNVTSAQNEVNNIHYTKVITPIYISEMGVILDNNYATYPIISNVFYKSGKNFTLNMYKVDNAIKNNKSVELAIQTICLLGDCGDSVYGVEYVTS